jgi:hypothetical protein
MSIYGIHSASFFRVAGSFAPQELKARAVPAGQSLQVISKLVLSLEHDQN